MDFEQHDEHAGEQQPDNEAQEGEDLRPTSASTDETPSHEEATSESQSEQSSESSESPEDGEREGTLWWRTEEPGILTGTGSELQPGVGGSGDHPAPAVVVDPADGTQHVAGEPPAGTVAGGQAPQGDSSDLQSGGDVTDPEALERLNAVHEPEQIETDRPDIGTE